MRFLKASTLFAIPTLVKLLAGLFVVKIIALYLGAEGLGKLGQFMSLMAMVTILAGGGISTGIVKYVAEFRLSSEKLAIYVQAASWITLASSILAGAALALFATPIAVFLFKSTEYSVEIRVLALAQVAVAVSTFLLGILNGMRDVKSFATVNVTSVAIGMIGVFVGVRIFGFSGAMYGMMWIPACQLICLLIWYRWVFRHDWSFIRPRWNPTTVKHFSRFTLMQLTSVLTMQLAQIVIRNTLQSRTSWVEVGYWQGMTRFSDAYLQFITVVLANFFMPRISELAEKSAVMREVRTVYKIVVPLLLIAIPAIILCRDLIVRILFSASFLPMRDLFVWQVIGDLFKVVAYIAGYVAVAKAAARLYIGAEILQAGLLLLLCSLLIGKFGVEGAVMGYFFTYVIYAGICLFALMRYARS
ncbi:lipid III flippase WzxE [Pandoraea soli]